jgi:RNA polymerase sigma-70 factor (ECF subfamily)
MHKRESELEHVPEPSIGTPDFAARLDVGRLFRRLRPLDRQLLWLAHVEGEDHRSIAAALGLRERSIRVLLSRARHKLAALLTGAELN